MKIFQGFSIDACGMLTNIIAFYTALYKANALIMATIAIIKNGAQHYAP